jgi:hypothetical protein
MNQDDERRVLGAMKHIQETEKQLKEIQDGTDDTDPKDEADLWDDLLTLQMGMGAIRRKMATGEE